MPATWNPEEDTLTRFGAAIWLATALLAAGLTGWLQWTAIQQDMHESVAICPAAAPCYTITGGMAYHLFAGLGALLTGMMGILGLLTWNRQIRLVPRDSKTRTA